MKLLIEQHLAKLETGKNLLKLQNEMMMKDELISYSFLGTNITQENLL